MSKVLQKATLAGGCFWCIEAVFKRIKGVEKVVPGYTGGNTENPTYEEVSTGNTNHAEAIQITFDPEIISYKEILVIFWKTHDPTTLNQQGNDVGTQYRSAIFYHDENQKNSALELKQELERSKIFSNSIVTEIVEYSQFYPAEDYHVNFYARNRNMPYCKIIIDPKIKKFLMDFNDKIQV